MRSAVNSTSDCSDPLASSLNASFVNPVTESPVKIPTSESKPCWLIATWAVPDCVGVQEYQTLASAPVSVGSRVASVLSPPVIPAFPVSTVASANRSFAGRRTPLLTRAARSPW